MADPMTIAAVVGAGAAAKSAFDPETGKQTTQMDPAQQAMYEDLYRRSQGIAAQPFVPYTGKRVAGFSPDQLRAFQATRGMFEAGQQYDPLGTLSQLGQQPTPGLLQADIGAYQSPYQQEVIDLAMQDIQRQSDIARQQAQSRAIGAGAFGGSRSAVLEAEAMRPYAEQQARTAAGLRQAGFEQAQRAAESDIERQMRDRQFQAGIQQNLLGEQYRSLGLLGGIGGQQQLLQQRALDVPYGEFQRALQYPKEQFGLLSQAVTGTPSFGGTAQYQPSTMEGVTTALNILGSPFMQDAFSGMKAPQPSMTQPAQQTYSLGPGFQTYYTPSS
jgi:hypothetical protein